MNTQTINSVKQLTNFYVIIHKSIQAIFCVFDVLWKQIVLQ